MCAALVGGMDRLKNEYIEAAEQLGITLKVFTGQERSIKSRLGDVNMIILFTGKLSHAARKEAVAHAKAKKIPLHMPHAPGVSSLRKCLIEGKS